jgi:hypothetical protein
MMTNLEGTSIFSIALLHALGLATFSSRLTAAPTNPIGVCYTVSCKNEIQSEERISFSWWGIHARAAGCFICRLYTSHLCRPCCCSQRSFWGQAFRVARCPSVFRADAMQRTARGQVLSSSWRSCDGFNGHHGALSSCQLQLSSWQLTLWRVAE